MNDDDKASIVEGLYALGEALRAMPPVPRVFEVAPDEYARWQDGVLPDGVTALVRRTAGLPSTLSASIRVVPHLGPGEWVAWDGDGNEIGRGGR